MRNASKGSSGFGHWLHPSLHRVLVLFVCAVAVNSAPVATAQHTHDYGIYTPFVKAASSGMIGAVDLALAAIGSNLSVQAGPPPTVGGVELQMASAEEIGQLIEGATCLAGDAFLIDSSTEGFFGPDGALILTYSQAIKLAVKIAGTVIHELAHADWITNYQQVCAGDPPFWQGILDCHAKLTEQIGESQVPCTEAYAYEKESKDLCGLACAAPPGLKQTELENRATEAAAECARLAGLCPTIPLCQGSCRLA